MDSSKIVALARILSTSLLVLTACLVGFDAQTKVIFYTYARKATFKDLNALYLLVWIDTAAAVYNVVQLFRSCMLPKDRTASSSSYIYLAWGVYLLDQVATYVVFAGTTAATQASMFAVSGEKSFEWMKVCDRYTRFCIQIGGALVCGYIAAALMAITSSISAYALFRLYSPNRFLHLKLK